MSEKAKTQTEGEKKNSSWWLVLIGLIIGLIFYGIISTNNQQKQLERMVDNEIDDVNYCRSLAAEYGSQQDAIFHKVYNDCMDMKGW